MQWLSGYVLFLLLSLADFGPWVVPKQQVYRQEMMHSFSISTMISPFEIPLKKQDFGMKICGTVATLLNSAGVESVLWGSHLMKVYNVPIVLQV